MSTAEDPLVPWVVAVIMRAVAEGHRNGQRVPAGAVDVARMLARAGQSRPILDAQPSPVDSRPMPPIAVDYATAAAALDVSVRTVRRRVAAGVLPVIGTNHGRRIPVAALASYAEEQS